MLRMSKLTDYGTVVMTYLAAAEAGRRYTAAEIARNIRVAAPTVSKILKILARHGLVHSHRGVKGGYSLARSASEITMAEVISAMEGPFGLTECASNPGLCVQESSCSVRANWQKVNQAVRRALEGVTLAEMIQPLPSPQVVTFPPARPVSSGGGAAGTV